MATVPTAPRRHALGLPAGSVRSLHALLVVALFCVALLVPTQRVAVPPYLVYLLFIIIGHYFAAHGHSIGTAESKGSPLHLPPGTIRVVIILALVGSIGWKLYSDYDGLKRQYDATLEEMKDQVLLPILILGGFLLGVLLRGIVGRHHDAYWFQDLEAWLSVIALVGLGIAVILHSVINPSLAEPVSMHGLEGALGAIIAFYFGERS